MSNIADNLTRVRARLQQAAAEAGRNADEIQLLAVSKTKPAADLRQAYSAGQRCFGENYLQEALEKQQQLADLAIEWHFIGPIQSNKTRPLALHFDWVHSVDRIKIARRLSEQREHTQAPLNICLQVNIDGEDTKSGVSFSELPELARAVSALPNLNLRGLMAIPAPRSDEQAQRQVFSQLTRALAQLHQEPTLASLDTLSMGMSGDLAAAVDAGSTMVRIGTDIFGARQKTNT